MAAKEYVIKAIKKGSVWNGSYGEFQDYALALNGVGEPVKISLPLPILEDPEIGDRLFGRLYQEEANGRTYYKLKLEKRPEEDVRQMDIHAQVAIKLAVEIWLGQGADPKAYDSIEIEALHFARMISNVREELKK